MNARIHTLQALPGSHAAAEAFAFREGRITWVGTNGEARDRVRRAAGRAEVLDARGRAILPGFVDCHMHPVALGVSRLGVPCLPPGVRSLEQILAAVARRAEELPPGAWILGWGYDEHRLAEGRPPRREELDRAAPRHPVLLHRACGHIAVANSLALAKGGVTHKTPDPPGGAIDRDASGEPTGVLKEAAVGLVARRIPSRGAEEVARALEAAGRYLLSRGVTTVADMAVSLAADDAVGGYRLAVATGRFRPRVHLYVLAEELAVALGATAPGGRLDEIPGRLRLAGFKCFVDGSVSGRTAKLGTPYAGGSDTGLWTLAREELAERVWAVADAGYAVAIHAMGDEAVTAAARAIRAAHASRAAPGLEPRPRHRIEHATFTPPEALDLIAGGDILLVPQPVFLFAEGGAYLANVGPERTARAYPLATWLAEGVPFALSSDAPATAWDDPADPWLGIQAAATRQMWDGTPLGAGETIPVAEALHRYSAWGARALGAEREVGALAPGRRADFCVYDADPLALPVTELGRVRPEAVWVDGELVAGSPAALRARGA